jgi:hypothetical protein
MEAARSYGEMVSFGNAQIASSLSGMGTNSTNKLCRLGSDGKMICDIPTGLSGSNTANRLCRTDASGTLQCSTVATVCAAGQASKWNSSSFECVTPTTVSIYRASANGWTCGSSVPNAQKAMVTEPGDSFHQRPSIARCAKGYRVTGGGYHMVYWAGGGGNSGNSPDSSFPSSDSEFLVVAGGKSNKACFQAYAVCAK